MMSHPDESALLTGDEHLEQTRTKNGAVRCVFSTVERIKVGTGTTTRHHASKLYWYIEEVGDDQFSLRQINSKYVPAGDEETISFQTLVDDYLPELEFWEDKVIPAVAELDALVKSGEADRLDGKYYSAELHLNEALEIDEQNVRALFNLGLTYLAMEAMDKARDMMNELLKIRASFTGKDQHLFNDFGIALRKSGLLDEAAAYYSKALEYIQTDENLYYNLSRVQYERGDWAACVDALNKSRSLNANLAAASDLLKILTELSGNPDLCRKQGKPVFTKDISGRIGLLSDPAAPAKDGLGDGVQVESGRVRSKTPDAPQDGSDMDLYDLTDLDSL